MDRQAKEPKRYFSMAREGRRAEFYIYGDITSWPMLKSDVSAHSMVTALNELEDVDEIHVYINSYGGECAEGLAIYSALRRWAKQAKVYTYADGFACSIASVIFMAGDVRVMSRASLLMIHNAWSCEAGNADDLRKAADDLDVITERSVMIYLEAPNIDEATVRELMAKETWLSPEAALAYGFATRIDDAEGEHPSQSVRSRVMALLTGAEAHGPREREPAPEAGTPEPIAPEAVVPDPEAPEAKPEEAAPSIWDGFLRALSTMN